MIHALPLRRRADLRSGRLFQFALAGLGVALWCYSADRACAQGPSRIGIKIGDSSDEKAALKIKEGEQEINLTVRPNQTLSKFVFIGNESNDAVKKYRVELRTGAKVLATLDLAEVPKDKWAKLTFPKAPPTTPPTTPSEAVQGRDVSLQLSVIDKEKPEVHRELAIKVQTLLPTAYINAPSPTLDIKPGTRDRIVTAAIEAKKAEFSGPDCRVEFKVDPNQMPGLESMPEGNLEGKVSRDNGYFLEVRLPFSKPPDNGLFSFAVDDYPRAFVFQGDFEKGAGQKLLGIPGNTPRARLLVNGNADETVFVATPNPSEPLKPINVKVEIDNAEPDQAFELAFSPTGKSNFPFKVICRGDRDRKVHIDPTGPEGSIGIHSEVKDWIIPVPMTGITGGVAKVRVKLLDRNQDMTFLKTGKVVEDLEKSGIRELLSTIVFDRTAPEGGIVGLAPRATRGKRLIVKSQPTDKESPITEVFYFVGEPDVDVATGVKKLPASLKPKDKIVAAREGEFWQADMQLPDEKKRILVTAQFTNKAGLVAFDTKEIELIDPEAKAKTGNIKGIVLEGPNEQEGLNVVLIDLKGAQVGDMAKTDKDGIFEFKDVAPGLYRLGVHKKASRTDARATAKVEAGKTTEANLELRRMSK